MVTLWSSERTVMIMRAKAKSFPIRVADGAGAFFDEQDSGCEIPFVLRLDGEGSPDTIGSSGEAQRRQEPLLLMDFYSSARAAYL